jgi:oligopeptide/dipeptide ABC transporter ATP-binding protein
MSEELLRVRGLTVRYPGMERLALMGLDLDVMPGEGVAIVGESGSGKSTAALAATRLLDPAAAIDATELSFEGQDLLRMSGRELRSVRARRIGMIFQDPSGSWNPARRIGAQLMDGLRAAGYEGDGRARLITLLRRVGIERAEDRLDDYPHHFSGGMLQRAMIAGALATGPSLLVADEPTSALDTTVQAELLQLMDELRTQTGVGLLMISHDLGVVSRVADRTMVLYAGSVVEQGPTALLFEQPTHPYTWGLIASIPRFYGPRKVRLRTVGTGEVAASGCSYAPRCPLAIDRCRTEVPTLRSVEGRDVACHRAEEAPVELERGA